MHSIQWRRCWPCRNFARRHAGRVMAGRRFFLVNASGRSDAASRHPACRSCHRCAPALVDVIEESAIYRLKTPTFSGLESPTFSDRSALDRRGMSLLAEQCQAAHLLTPTAARLARYLLADSRGLPFTWTFALNLTLVQRSRRDPRMTPRDFCVLWCSKLPRLKRLEQALASADHRLAFDFVASVRTEARCVAARPDSAEGN